MAIPTPPQIEAAVQARRDDIVEMLLDLVGVSSVTGNEGDVQQLVGKIMREQGLDVDEFLSSRDEIKDYLVHVGEQASYENRPSLVGTRKGSGGGKSLLFNGHVDTVPVEDRERWHHAPEGELVGDRVYGLGSSDMKGGVVANLAVPMILADLGVTLKGDLMVNSVTGEEDGGLGTLSTILQGYRADGVVITEPTLQKIAVASGGSLVFRITVHGKAAHGANRNKGVSAIEKFIPIFQALLAWEAERQQTVFHPLYDHLENKFPISVGTLRSGDWASTVPDKLVAEGRLGFLPGEDMESMMQQTRELVARVAEADDWMRENPPVVEFFSGQFTADEIAVDHPLTLAMKEAHRKLHGEDPEIIGFTGGADTRLWVRIADCPALNYGPGVYTMAHQSNEYIEIPTLLQTIAVMTQLAMDWCEVAEEKQG